ncbi:hypothetical protein BJV78DRAFT_846385 [Lactifluus subvellereus]|nr:hypothetical protein BJV78DRAFT_846385 [Lactifluus subvellereus]
MLSIEELCLVLVTALFPLPLLLGSRVKITRIPLRYFMAIFKLAYAVNASASTVVPLKAMHRDLLGRFYDIVGSAMPNSTTPGKRLVSSRSFPGLALRCQTFWLRPGKAVTRIKRRWSGKEAAKNSITWEVPHW